MEIRYLIIAAGVMIAAIANASMDILRHKFSSSIFSEWNEKFWNPSISWKNKYKDYPVDKRAKWWFPLPVINTKNYWVFLTDGWHLFKWIMLWAISIAAVPEIITGFEGRALLEIAVIRYGFGIIFELFYSIVLIRNEKL